MELGGPFFGFPNATNRDKWVPQQKRRLKWVFLKVGTVFLKLRAAKRAGSGSRLSNHGSRHRASPKRKLSVKA